MAACENGAEPRVGTPVEGLRPTGDNAVFVHELAWWLVTLVLDRQLPFESEVPEFGLASVLVGAPRQAQLGLRIAF